MVAYIVLHYVLLNRGFIWLFTCDLSSPEFEMVMVSGVVFFVLLCMLFVYVVSVSTTDNCNSQ